MIDPGREPSAAERYRAQVKRHMKAHSVTQRMLAAAMGVTEKHMSQVFRGRIRLTFELAEEIATHLGLLVEVRAAYRPSPDSDGLFIDVDGSGLVTLTQTTDRPLHVFVNGEYQLVDPRGRQTFAVTLGSVPA